MTAGVSVIRTRTASTSTPTASPNPIGRTIARCENAKPRNTEVMMIAAAVTTLAPCDEPGAHGRAGVLRRATRASRMPDTRNIW